MPYGLSYTGPDVMGQSDSGDPTAALVAHLLATLENPQPTPPPRVSAGQDIVGSLGDAIKAMATVRAGGTPPAIGAYAAGLKRQQDEYDKAREAATLSGAENRNRVRIGTFENQARLEGEKQLARIRLQGQKPLVSWQQKLVNGEPHTIQVIMEPTTGGIISMQDFGEKFVPPAISPYIDESSGAVNLGRVSRTTGNVAPVTVGGKQVGAVPPSGIVTDVSKGQATIQGLESVMDAYHTIRNQTSQQSPIGQWLRERATQNAPGPTSAWLPEYATYVATRQRALNSYIKSVTGAQFSVAELQRYERQFPEPWDPEEVATSKLDQLRQQALADMQAKLKLYPSLGGKPKAGGAKKSASQFVDEYLGASGGNQ